MICNTLLAFPFSDRSFVANFCLGRYLLAGFAGKQLTLLRRFILITVLYNDMTKGSSSAFYFVRSWWSDLPFRAQLNWTSRLSLLLIL